MLQHERYLLMTQGGLSYQDWRVMPRWVRLDFLARNQLEMQQRGETLRQANWKQLLGMLVRRLLGLE